MTKMTDEKEKLHRAYITALHAEDQADLNYISAMRDAKVSTDKVVLLCEVYLKAADMRAAAFAEFNRPER